MLDFAEFSELLVSLTEDVRGPTGVPPPSAQARRPPATWHATPSQARSLFPPRRLCVQAVEAQRAKGLTELLDLTLEMVSQVDTKSE